MPKSEAHNTTGAGTPASLRKPLLASEALREDLAPIEPARGGARVWAIALGVILCGLGAIPPPGSAAYPLWGPVSDSLWGPRVWTDWAPQVCLGAVAILAGAMPVPYALRATAITFVGTATAIIGVAGFGPMAGIARAVGEWGLLHYLAGAGLPAALLFRARYRAYPGARRILTLAILLSLPFAAWCVLRITAGPLSVQITSAVALLAVATTPVGFMGAETTVAGEWIAAAVIAAIGAQLVAETLLMITPTLDIGLLPPSGTALGFAASCILGGIGVFQLLARRHWSAARAIDVKRTHQSRPPAPSSDPWSTQS